MMGKRHCIRGLAKDRVYQLKTAARIIGVSENTFRKYPDRGLRIMADSRPKLVRGADLLKFLNDQAKLRKQPGEPEQFYCLGCKAQTDALGGLADYIALTSQTGRLVALCAQCEGLCSKFSSPEKARSLCGILEINFTGVTWT